MIMGFFSFADRHYTMPVFDCWIIINTAVYRKNDPQKKNDPRLLITSFVDNAKAHLELSILLQIKGHCSEVDMIIC